MALTISLKSKKVLVTGASRGLGHDLVEALYAQEAIIYALVVNPENLVKLKNEFPNITTVCVDLFDLNETRKAVEAIGPLDCLVNNAAATVGKPFLETTEDIFDQVVGVDLKAVLNVSQIVVKGMMETGNGGSIVNISSICSQRSNPLGSPLYSTVKAGLDMLTKCMAVEFGPHKIRVNTVNPGLFETGRTREYLAQFKGTAEDNPEFVTKCPMGRLVNTKEIVNAILFLLSDVAPMINGDNLVIDGGYILS